MMETGSIVSRRCMNRDRIRLTGRLQKITGCKSVPFFILFDPLPDLPPRGKEFLEHFPLGRNGKKVGSILYYLILNTLSSIGISTSTLVKVVTISIPAADVVVFIGKRIPLVSV